MKKNLLVTLSLSLSVATAFSAGAQDIVIFEDDFEWLDPWAEAGDGNPCGNTIGDDDIDANAPQLKKPVIDLDGVQVSAYKALTEKGYTFTAYCNSAKAPRKPEEQAYLQRNYLKLGLTGYQTAITLPKLSITTGGLKTTLSFDWCPMRQGSGVYDYTQLVVVVKNGENEDQFPVPDHKLEKYAKLSWIPTTIDLRTIVNSESSVTIRNADYQIESSKALRFFIDNIKVTQSDTSGIEEIEAAESAPEYYSVLGVKVENPTSGLYIRRQGSKVEKVMIK